MCRSVVADEAVYFSDKGMQITLSEPWQETLIGNMFYDADFIFVDDQTKDMLIIEVYPKHFMLDTKGAPTDKQELDELLTSLNVMQANDDFYNKDEQITSVTSHNKKNLKGITFTSQYGDSQLKNYSWLGNNSSHMVHMKIITKSAQSYYSDDEIFKWLEQLNIVDPVINVSDKEPMEPTFGHDFYLSGDLYQTDRKKLGELYQYTNKVFFETGKVSAFTVSSLCTGMTVPPAVLTSVILEDFGLNDVLFRENTIYHKQNLPITLTQYETDKNEPYHTISTVVEAHGCQHLLFYVVGRSEPLLDKFFTFLQHFEPRDITFEQFIEEIPATDKEDYAATLLKIANQLDQLKMYKKSGELYAQAFKIKPHTDHVIWVLNNYNNRQQYHKALTFIAELDNAYINSSVLSWQAWFYSKTKEPQKSVDAFQKVFAKSYTDDEDFFKYIEQLRLLENYQDITQLIEKYQGHVQDRKLLKKHIAQNLTQYDPHKAKAYIMTLLQDESFILDHQFTLLDYLADIKAYQEVIAFSQDRIVKGYESALLYNYLGDAQNALDDKESALISMTKARAMAPENTIIESYYQSLLYKNGKADLSSLPDDLPVVELPAAVKQKMEATEPRNHLDSYEYLYSVIAYYHEKDQKNRKTIYEKIKINNDGGVAKNKTLKIRFDQSYQSIYINHLNVLDENGAIIVSFDRSNAYISTDDDGITADEDKLLNIPIPALAVGVSIEYAITVESLSADHKQAFEKDPFVSSVATQYKAIVINGDLSNITVHANDTLNHQQVSEKMAYWDMKDLPNYKKTPLLPDFDQVFPFLQFSSIQPSWQEVGKDYLTSINDKINSSIDSQVMLNVIDESADKISNAQAIIAFVQKQISYQAIEFGMRAQIPNTSITTLKNNYGDCKDHSVVLHDMLNKAGIKANLVLVNADNDISTSLPTFGQFNHMIVYVPNINGGVFVDVTDKDTTLDLFSQPSNMQGYHALVLDKDESRIEKIPFTPPGQNVFDIQRTVDKKNNNIIYHEQATITGVYASIVRSYLKTIELDELESKIVSWINGYYSDLILVEFTHSNIYDNNQPLTLDFIFQQEAQDATITLPVFIERYALDFTKSPSRLWDFEFKDTFKVTSQTTIVNKKALKFKRIKKDIESQVLKTTVISNKKSITFESEVYNNRLPAEDYQQLTKQSKQSYKIMERALIVK